MNVASFEDTVAGTFQAIQPEAPHITIQEETETYTRIVAEPLSPPNAP